MGGPQALGDALPQGEATMASRRTATHAGDIPHTPKKHVAHKVTHHKPKARSKAKVKPIYRRTWVIVLASVVGFLILLRLALTPVVSWLTQHELNQIPNHKSSFESVSVSVLKLSYNLKGLRIVELPEKEGKKPVVAVDNVEAKVFWKDLLKFHLVGAASIEHADVHLSLAPSPGPKAKPPIASPDQLDDLLRTLLPFRVQRVEVRDSAITLTNLPLAHMPPVRVSHIEMTLENLADREWLNEGLPMTFALRAMLQKTGHLSVFLTANPLAKKLRMAGQAELTGLQLAELSEVAEGQAGVKVTQGVFDVFAQFDVKNDTLTGGVKPLVKHLEVESADDGFVNGVKAWAVDRGFELLSDRVPGRHAVATTIPIHGTIKDPKVQILPTVLAVVRNAFVLGLTESFTNTPPPKADEPEGVLKQTKQALTKDEGPKTQPTETKQPDKK